MGKGGSSEAVEIVYCAAHVAGFHIFYNFQVVVFGEVRHFEEKAARPAFRRHFSVVPCVP